MGDVAKDLTAGTVGGAANLIVGHPFDTIKVKLQSQPTPAPGQLPKYSGAIDAVKQTIAAERPRGLYKGMGAPLATVAAFNALLFAARGQMEALLRTEPGVPLTPKQQVVAGAGAGFAVSFLACPTELIKCRSDVSCFYLNYLFWQLQYSLGFFSCASMPLYLSVHKMHFHADLRHHTCHYVKTRKCDTFRCFWAHP
jgi:hypothetical protein